VTVATYSIDTSQWPIVIHSVHGALSDAQIDEYIREANRVLDRRAPHVTIMDTRGIGRTSAYTRARSREWVKEHHAQLREFCIGTVYVLESPLLRFVVMSSLLVTRLPTPYRVCETIEEAKDWAKTRIAEREASRSADRR
jgi:hypothetical protein